jgi:NAD(P)H-dependent FMN reductase
MQITIVSGSNHEGSTTLRLCTYVQRCLESEGFSVKLFDVHTMPLPVMSEQEKYEGHEHVTNLRDWMNEADGIVLATPEYHGAPSGALKNALDFLWPQFRNKPTMVASVAGGAVGVSSLLQLQMIVRQVHGINAPEWISLCGPDRAFGDDGAPENPKTQERVQKACAGLAQLVRALR